MFRKNLLATTALIVTASAAAAGAQPVAGADTRMRDSVASRNVNDEFLCTYGSYPVSLSREADSGGSFYISWTHVAAPIKGHGKTVNQIIVQEALTDGHSRTAREFSAGIYTDDHGQPGKLITSGTGALSTHCANVTVKINPTKLARNKTYWVEESTSRKNATVFWAINPRAKYTAYVQQHYSSSYWHQQGFHSSTTPWNAQPSGTYLKVR
jgi:hypothetical protein